MGLMSGRHDTGMSTISARYKREKRNELHCSQKGIYGESWNLKWNYGMHWNGIRLDLWVYGDTTVHLELEFTNPLSID